MQKVDQGLRNRSSLSKGIGVQGVLHEPLEFLLEIALGALHVLPCKRDSESSKSVAKRLAMDSAADFCDSTFQDI